MLGASTNTHASSARISVQFLLILTFASGLDDLLELAVLSILALPHLHLDSIRVKVVILASQKLFQRLVAHDLNRLEVRLNEHRRDSGLEMKSNENSTFIFDCPVHLVFGDWERLLFTLPDEIGKVIVQLLKFVRIVFFVAEELVEFDANLDARGQILSQIVTLHDVLVDQPLKKDPPMRDRVQVDVWILIADQEHVDEVLL